MATISVSLPGDGTTADVADYNNPITTIVDEINGGLDNSNIASGAAIAGSKLATDSVTDTQLDYPRWGAEIGRTTLSSAGDTISVTGIPARKYLRIIISTIDTGGTHDLSLRFNNDSGSEYAYRRSSNGGADTTGTDTTSILVSSAGADPKFVVLDVVNIAAQEKLVTGSVVTRATAGEATAPARSELVAKYDNTADQITRVDIINGGGTGDYAIGSEVVVLGHD